MNWVIKLIDRHKPDTELDPFTIDEAVRIYRPNVKVKKDVNPVSARNIICGSILGDIIGEPYEFANGLFGYKPENKLLYDSNTYTDDTILTLATLDAILHSNQYDDAYCLWGHKYFSSYGSSFVMWLGMSPEERHPYNSCGNGSAMRVSPVGVMFDNVDDVIREAYKSASCTHNHPEGIQGAIVTAVCVWIAIHGTIEDVFKYVGKYYNNQRYKEKRFSNSIEVMNKMNSNNELCQGAVPHSFKCLEIAYRETGLKDLYTNTMKQVLFANKDTDTMGAIVGAAAAALDPEINCYELARPYLTDEMISLLDSVN